MLLPNDAWDKITIETYKEAYAEAKAKHEDVLLESESITTKSIRILILIFALCGWVAINVNKIDARLYYLLIIFVLLVSYIVWLLITLLFPKAMPIRGTHPSSMFIGYKDYINPAYTEEIKNKVFYYKQIVKYKKKIDKVVSINTSRQRQYKSALILSFIIFILSGFLYAFRITNP